MAYNTRTATLIQKWLANSGVKAAHVKVLKSVYKDAWKEKIFCLDNGDAPLHALRIYRDSCWWQTWRAITTRSTRRKAGVSHAQGGQQKTSWEHPFVTVWGVHWRTRLNAATKLAEWMRGYTEFEHVLCRDWHLPGEPQGEQSYIPAPFISVKMPTSPNDPPLLVPNPREQLWDAGGPRLWIQTDNQQVAEVFAGRSLMTVEALRPNCINIARILWRLLDKGFRPRTDITTFIEWDPREFNALADHAANCALDQRSGWEVAGASSHDALPHFRLCVDGARRGSGQASGGMAVLAYNDVGGSREQYRAGTLFANLDSAFASEVLSMEWALETFWRTFVEK